MNQKNGITLIALVLTVIVMVILAGVSLNAVIGDNGILSSAMLSKLEHEESAAKEQLEMAWAARMTKYLETIISPAKYSADSDLAAFMEELNKELAGNGTIEGITWDSSSNQYLVLFRSPSGTLFYTSITPAGKVGVITAQGNPKRTVEEEKYIVSSYTVNTENSEEKRNYNASIYAFVYYDDDENEATLVFNNVDQGLNNSELTLQDSWNNSEDNFNFSHSATQERIEREERSFRRGSRDEIEDIEYVLWKEYVENITEVIILNPIYPETLDYFFAHMIILQQITNFTNLKTDHVVSMNGLFLNCAELENLNISHFNTTRVTNMEDMFSGCVSMDRVTIGNGFDTSNVTNMVSMFMDCQMLRNFRFLSQFNTSNVNDMSYMFCNCNYAKTLNVSSFDTSKVEEMRSMFMSCTSLESIDISNFNLASINCFRQLDSMFYDCEKLVPIFVSDSFRFTILEDDFDDFGDEILDGALLYVPVTYEGVQLYKMMTLEEFFGYTEFDDNPNEYVTRDGEYYN